MENNKYNLMLADDDIDDCTFFKDALSELPLSASLTTANNGKVLMDLLSIKSNALPDMLFLDLNMPLKKGFDCLLEIKQSTTLKTIPVIILSTAYNPEMATLLYTNGAHHYIKKPISFSDLKNVIQKAIFFSGPNYSKQPSKEQFLIHP